MRSKGFHSEFSLKTSLKRRESPRNALHLARTSPEQAAHLSHVSGVSKTRCKLIS